ncbi:GntR family transcriptional regulator [Agaricicola taiwanensis]|uniref:GntR family transcriptional regulator n=1 Tax=Agaricicola taiwanensis TaxID=591372 RepID=A0A8J2VLN4_9RHOB|nr:GntR family transcriptional regulator [Agaricicola taiwanensis]
MAPLQRDVRENLSTHVERHIRSSLLAGRFTPGDRISLISLAETLGTSVTPVREALSRLAAERAFELIPGQIARVPRFDAQRYAELRDIRVAVEGLAAERAAERITKRELAKLKRVLNQFNAASQAGEVERMLLDSRDFRFMVYEASGMPALVRIIEGLWLQSAPSFRLMYGPNDRDELLENAYGWLLQALTDHDPAEAKRAVERAVTMGASRLISIVG